VGNDAWRWWPEAGVKGGLWEYRSPAKRTLRPGIGRYAVHGWMQRGCASSHADKRGDCRTRARV